MAKYYIYLTLMLLITSCAAKPDFDSFIDENPALYNRSIESAIGEEEEWVRSPESIVKTLFIPDDPAVESSLEYVDRSSQNQVLKLTLEGLKDDSVQGEMRLIRFSKKGNQWQITEIRRGFKCREGRGQTVYSGNLCH